MSFIFVRRSYLEISKHRLFGILGLPPLCLVGAHLTGVPPAPDLHSPEPTHSAALLPNPLHRSIPAGAQDPQRHEAAEGAVGRHTLLPHATSTAGTSSPISTQKCEVSKCCVPKAFLGRISRSRKVSSRMSPIPPHTCLRVMLLWRGLKVFGFVPILLLGGGSTLPGGVPTAYGSWEACWE